LFQFEYAEGVRNPTQTPKAFANPTQTPKAFANPTQTPKAFANPSPEFERSENSGYKPK